MRQNTKHHFRLMFAMVFALSMDIVRAVPFQPTDAPKSALDLIVLHNNDMHARFEQTDKFSANCGPDEEHENKCYGGFARVSYVLKEYRKRAESGGPAVLYLNAGDTYTGTPWFTIHKDRIVSDFMNILKPDAISLGNHELDLGVKGLVPFLNAVNFPVLVCNINNTMDHPLWKTNALRKSVVFDIKGVKVGVVGYLTPETKLVAIPNDLEFISEVLGINHEAEALKNKGVNIIIALGHSGYEVDKDIAKNCPLVDVVIGGHSNTFLYTGTQPDVEKVDGPYPTVIKQISGKEVPVVQAYAFTKYLGELELSFDADGNLIHWGGEPILLNGTIQRDPDVIALLDKYRPEVIALTEAKIGVAKVHLDGHSCRTTECNLGNMITDAHIYTRVNQYNGTYWTDAAIALLQGGGIRRSFTPGIMSKFDLKTILPFNNSMFVVNMTGNVLLDVLEHSVELYTGDRGEFMQMSGLRVVYDMDKSPGHRIVSAEALCAQCEVPSYSKIEPSEEYGVLVSDFLINGGDGYLQFKDLKREHMDIIEFDSVLKYIEETHWIYPAMEGRVTLLNMKNPEPIPESKPSQSAPGSAPRITLSMSLISIFALTIINFLQ